MNADYQFHDFACERPLDEPTRARLAARLPRAELDEFRLTATVRYGDLPVDPGELVETTFDGHLYLAGWGERELTLRLPRGILALERAQRYLDGDINAAWETDDSLLLALGAEERLARPARSLDQWLPALLPLREALSDGDPRALYLGWLLAVDRGEVEDDAPEPPLPAGLDRLDGGCSALLDFFELPASLLAVAAEASPPLTGDAARRGAIVEWLADVPSDTKDAWLLRAALGETGSLSAELIAAFRVATASEGPWPVVESTGRTAGMLREASGARSAEATGPAAPPAPARPAPPAARPAPPPAPASTDAPADEAWAEIEACIAARKAERYARAAELLRGLQQEFAACGQPADYPTRLRAIVHANARKSRLLQALDAAGVQR